MVGLMVREGHLHDEVVHRLSRPPLDSAELGLVAVVAREIRDFADESLLVDGAGDGGEQRLACHSGAQGFITIQSQALLARRPSTSVWWQLRKQRGIHYQLLTN